ncbi:transcriptional repressor [Marichromatium gracile]|uniref:Ferric uptake regulation protein n=1 Tax=Marichromatium gracile TaxID=1048 RepID=A0A4R4A9B9_MARGR|nr:MULTISPECIES: Fur family transcriptional regulator [Marichromatium]MBO8086399.1 transcriptional repressor [Marichromatium sp.]MBK1710279.1 transcriptional repressor [Marichromatium gracile]MCF1184726.1 transcriptional repressor [Marichromatium gracile]RNE88612.1 transcriptional repressor [Marichromatium sp. AB31]TCW35522.1 Fur family zinc uptake transcriptional regulator [Marichromatium gracile]
MSAEERLERATRLCAGRGARLTPQRARVLRILIEAERPLGAYEILAEMAEGQRALAPPTVYRALEFLLAQGLVHRLETLNAFIDCRHPERPHPAQFLICSACGRVVEIDDEAIAARLLDAATQSGFAASRKVVEVIGVCEGCR